MVKWSVLGNFYMKLEDLDTRRKIHIKFGFKYISIFLVYMNAKMLSVSYEAIKYSSKNNTCMLKFDKNRSGSNKEYLFFFEKSS